MSGSPDRSLAAAMLAVARLLSTEARADVGHALVAEARALLGAQQPVLYALEDAGRIAVVVAGGAKRRVEVAAHPGLRTLLAQAMPSFVDAEALLLALPSAEPTHVLCLSRPAPFAAEEVAAAEALAVAGAAALARDLDAERHAALTRAAKVLHESLDLPVVLQGICEEATRILDGDYTAVYLGTRDGIVLDTAHGLPPETVGYELTPGQGLSGRVLQSGEPALTNDYAAIADFAADSPFARVRACLAVPMRWDGELHGVLTVGYFRPFLVNEEHLGLLETFAELASVACTNASLHAGMALAARTDALTGCLNHAALHESLRREIERAERSVTPTLSLVMLDLDDFKSVNERHGHLVGDEVLRRAGHALRQATRPYDVAARYGGDEFALVAVEAGEEEAEEIARRAVESITLAIGDLCEGEGGHATAGVAQWEPGLSPNDLVARADRALLFGKHEDGRGRTIQASSVPEWFRPGRFSRRGGRDDAPAPAPSAARAPRSDGGRPAEERLRERTRRLAQVNVLGARMTAMDDPLDILEAAAEELLKSLGAECVTVLRQIADGSLVHTAGAPGEDSGLAGRCVRERRGILAAEASARGRLAVPLMVAGSPWGAIEAHGARPAAFDADDLHLAETVAELTGAALHSALRYAVLERAYRDAVGTTPEA
jgi:diguanylate cyclase (GGDEF)-like protein